MFAKRNSDFYVNNQTKAPEICKVHPPDTLPTSECILGAKCVERRKLMLSVYKWIQYCVSLKSARQSLVIKRMVL